MVPWFYISYANVDGGEDLITRFHSDLAKEVSLLIREPSTDFKEIGFMDLHSIELGEAWPSKQAEALATTRTLICIYSQAYFRSEMCGKEFQAFLNRLDNFVTSEPKKNGLPPLILPILWESPETLPRPLPPAVARIQYSHEEFDGKYRVEGVRALMKRSPRKDYPKFVAQLARLIVDRAQKYPLPPWKESPDLSKISSAFVSRSTEPTPQPIVTPPQQTASPWPFSPTLESIIAAARGLTAEMLSGAVTTPALLFALSIEGRYAKDDGIRRFVYEQFAAVPQDKYRKAFKAVNSSESEDFTELTGTDIGKISPNALAVLRQAKEFSELTPRDGKIHSRHLLAALLTPRSEESAAQTALRELGIDSLQLRQAFLEKLNSRGYIGSESGKDSGGLWKYILFTDPADNRLRTSGFSSDVFTDVDLLGIDKDVEAFATLIAARTVNPPLSIGIFGDWGSGKSFFMRRLMKRIDAITAAARRSDKPQSEVGVYRRVAQIEFNAWHYVEGNLWASLVENIFQNLKISQAEEDDDQALIKRRDALLETLRIEEAAQARVEEQAKEAKEQVRLKEDEVKQVAQAHKDKTDALAELSSKEALAAVELSLDLNAQTKAEINQVLTMAGLTLVGNAASDLQSALREARSVYERGNTLLTPLLKAPDGRKRFYMLLFVILAAPILGFGARYLMLRFGSSIGNLSAILTFAATFMTAGARWIKQQSAWMSQQLRKAEEIKVKVDKQADEEIARVRAENAKEMATHTQELELLKTQYASLLAELADAQKRVEQINSEIRQGTAVQRLAKFIQDRAASDDYRKYLGLLALIRRDFSSLSNLIEKGNEELGLGAKSERNEEDVAPVNRIVLYIDDLDRCPPRKVIAVLQAVHLLLAFPLFVVVVGVDGRWVAQSLRKSYPGLLGDNQTEAVKVNGGEVIMSSATPHDYLEKIFQIPFWLNPLDDKSTKEMLRNLMPMAVDGEEHVITLSGQNESFDMAADEVSLTELRTEQATTTIIKSDDLIPVQTTGESAAKEVQSSSVLELGAAKKAGGDIDLNPASLDTVSAELEFVEALAPLLGRSPRSVKRFINIYRLVKVRLAPVETASFLDETLPNAEFKVVMFLLSVATGMPIISRDLFQTLMRVQAENTLPAGGSITHTGHDFTWLIKEASGPNHFSTESEWARLEKWLARYDNGSWMTMDIGTAAAWSNRIARYSFNIRQGVN